MRPGEGQPLLLHAVSDQRLQGLHSGGQLEVLQAAVLDRPDADIGQGRDAPLQLDSCDAGLLLDPLLDQPPGLLADLSGPP